MEDKLGIRRKCERYGTEYGVDGMGTLTGLGWDNMEMNEWIAKVKQKEKEKERFSKSFSGNYIHTRKRKPLSLSVSTENDLKRRSEIYILYSTCT